MFIEFENIIIAKELLTIAVGIIYFWNCVLLHTIY